MSEKCWPVCAGVVMSVSLVLGSAVAPATAEEVDEWLVAEIDQPHDPDQRDPEADETAPAATAPAGAEPPLLDQPAKTPTITGTKAALSAVKVSTSGWAGTKSYQWFVDGKAVPGNAGKSSSLKLATGHIGKKVHVRVTSTRDGYHPKTLDSAKHTVAAAVLKAPKPKITGKKAPGGTLKVSTGKWTKGAKLKYQWYVNGKAVKGAKKKSFKLKSSHNGKKVHVRVTGSKKHYRTAKVASSKVSLKKTMEQEMLQLVNKARSKSRYCGTKKMPAAKKLKLNSKLNLASKRHSAEMAEYNYFDHTGRNGSQFTARAKKAGTTARAENLAAGHKSPKVTLDQWLKSPSHCVNVMGKAYKEMGVGKGTSSKSTYKTYWTQMFR